MPYESDISSKFITEYGNCYSFDISVGTTAVQILTNEIFTRAVTILADPANTDTVFIGSSGGQTYPLRAGTTITIYAVRLDLIYVRANSGTQTLHIIYGGW